MAVFSTLKTPLSWSLSSGNSLRSLSTPKARARPLQSTCHWLKQKRFRARRLGGNAVASGRAPKSLSKRLRTFTAKRRGQSTLRSMAVRRPKISISRLSTMGWKATPPKRADQFNSLKPASAAKRRFAGRESRTKNDRLTLKKRTYLLIAEIFILLFI